MKSHISHYTNDVFSFKNNLFMSFKAPSDQYSKNRMFTFNQSKDINDISDEYETFFEKNKENIIDMVGSNSEYLGFCLITYNPVPDSENIGIFIPSTVSFKDLVQNIVHLLILNLALAFEKRNDLRSKYIFDVASKYVYKALEESLKDKANLSVVPMYDKYTIVHVDINAEQINDLLRSERFYITYDDTTQYIHKKGLLHSRHFIENFENKHKLYFKYTDIYGWFYLNFEPKDRVFLIFSNYFHPDFIYKVITYLLPKKYKSIEFHLSIEIDNIKALGVKCNKLSDNYYTYLLELD